ncbi:hypothetical protein PROFUN_09995 [Planoprotostelium fungivorum]|uniref:Succinate dehydrogenase assembly factor 4, mitochondrial n=1 Tax=Planoprotostelium fungivorum TaxID=1890364 RepID=A0A2P6NFP5_9EUKA|nr:hypothetical protein PROFUN_09995 [Planoprotostelium fungivorum]
MAHSLKTITTSGLNTILRTSRPLVVRTTPTLHPMRLNVVAPMLVRRYSSAEEDAMAKLQRLRQKLDKEQKQLEDEAADSDEQVYLDKPEDYHNPNTGEIGGFKGKEPTRNNDWEHRGRCTDF